MQNFKLYLRPINEILEDHPELEKEDLLASIYYSRLSISGDVLKEVS
jgi:uncharacterized protein (DUF433 family)